jgi:hypothetical protein
LMDASTSALHRSSPVNPAKSLLVLPIPMCVA